MPSKDGLIEILKRLREQKYKLGIATIHSINELQNENFETLDKIQTVSLDSYEFQHPIGFMKIDVEGKTLYSQRSKS